MNWDYIAGLFDGDGCANFAMKWGKAPQSINKSISVSPLIQLAVSGDVIEPLSDFLLKEDIAFLLRNKRKTEYIIIPRWKSGEKFVKNIIEQCYIKKAPLKLMLEGFELHTQLKKDKATRINKHLDEFQQLRIKISKYGRKGNRIV